MRLVAKVEIMHALRTSAGEPLPEVQRIRDAKKKEANGDAIAKPQIWYQALGQTCEICILQKISEKHLSNLVPSNLHTPQKNKEILESTRSNL